MPLISSDHLRFEVFKYYYKVKNNDFDLYKKADSSEFIQILLELVHFCLNQDVKKKDIESPCKPICIVHEKAVLN